jgi:small subunit ribosomal protein S2
MLQTVRDYMVAANKSNKKFLFIGTKPEAAAIIQTQAKRCGASYVNKRWLGGTLTNFLTVKRQIRYFDNLSKNKKRAGLNFLTNKEVSRIHRKQKKFIKNLSGLSSMEQIPDIVFIVDPKRERNALLECAALDIPVVALLDTDCSPDLIKFAIPANDDAPSSIELILSYIVDALINKITANRVIKA